MASAASSCKAWAAGSCATSALRRDQREHRALRVEAVDDPASARNRLRTVDDLPASRLDAGNGRIDGIDVEVVEPERLRNVRHLVHHAARLRAADGKNLIGTDRP